MTTTTNEEQYRAGFEAWFVRAHGELGEHLLRRYDNGQYRNTAVGGQFEAWAEAKREASTEPSALTACANCLRPNCEHNAERCPAPYTTVWHAWDYKMQPMPTYKEYGAGALPDEAQDAARLEVFIDWYLREGSRSEVHLYGHTVPTTREIVIAWLDRAAIESQAKAGKGEG